MPDQPTTVLEDACRKDHFEGNERKAFFWGAMTALEYVRLRFEDGKCVEIDYAKLNQLENELGAFGF